MLNHVFSSNGNSIGYPSSATSALGGDRTAHRDADAEAHHREEVTDGYLEQHRPAPTPQEAPLSQSSLESDAKRWIALIQCGDQRGLNQLHTAFRRTVFVSAMFIVRREEMAHEVVSSCFMQVWKNAARYDPARGTVVAWLMLIAKSRSFDALRRANVVWHRELSPQDGDPLLRHEAEVESEPSAHLARKVRCRRLQRALLRLSPMQRQVLSLTTLDGLSQDEASRHLQLPLGTVKSHARRGLLALRHRCDSIGLYLD